MILLILLTSLIFAILAIFLVSLVNINVRNNARNQIAIVRAIFEGQEQERQRIARDLHDGLGAQLSTIKLYQELRNQTDNDDGNKSSDHSAELMIDKAMDDLRLITRNLLPITITEYGLISQLYELKVMLNNANNLKVDIQVNDPEMRFSNEFEINVYRILQEMINNTLKYANAREISVDIYLGHTQLIIHYSDDGEGMDIKSVKKGLGINNIETRTKFYDGKVELQSSIGQGTNYTILFDKSQI